jgi:hypothetical protein
MAQLITVIKKFADDTKLGQVIRSQVDKDLLQGCLDQILGWAETWGMSFNQGCGAGTGTGTGRNRIHLGTLEPEPYSEYGSGSGSEYKEMKQTTPKN